MYEWWRLQQYLIALKMLKTRISIEKVFSDIFYYVWNQYIFEFWVIKYLFF